MVGKVAIGAEPVPGIQDFDGGALASTGLILNDVDKHDGRYYGTNLFSEPYAMGADTRPARLIRWRTWEDFANGRWQDLSDRIPSNDPPRILYYISILDGILYTSAQVMGEDPGCDRTIVMRLDLASLPKPTAPPQVGPPQAGPTPPQVGPTRPGAPAPIDGGLHARGRARHAELSRPGHTCPR